MTPGVLSGTRALVTGATSGIGDATVLALARAGAEVVVAGRRPDRLAATIDRVRRQLPDSALQPLVLDLADLASVRRAAEEAAGSGRLHLLVNNAGVMATPYRRTVDGFELQLGTNHLGHFALTGLLLPALLESGGARVVTVSSQMHRVALRAPLHDPRDQPHRYQRWHAYAGSKLANLLFAFELDRRAHEAGLALTSTAAHPGYARTNLHNGHAHPRRSWILGAAVAAAGQSAEMGALPTLMAATTDLPGGTYVGPGGVGEIRGAPRVVSTRPLARDPEAARSLWEISEQATGVAYP